MKHKIHRIVVKSNSTNTIEFHRGYVSREYPIKTADAPRLYRLFNDDPWPATTEFMKDGTFEIEYQVSDRELPLDDLFLPDLEPDPLEEQDEYRSLMLDHEARIGAG